MNSEIISLYNQGLSGYRISQLLDIPHSTLHRKMTALGLSLKENSKVRQDKIKDHTDEIIAAYQAGKSSLEIAKQYNCDGSSITRLLQRSGIETRYQYTVDENFF